MGRINLTKEHDEIVREIEKEIRSLDLLINESIWRLF
jgi:hypothetical protein